MEQGFTMIVAACSLLAAGLSAYFAGKAANAARTSNQLELIRRRFEVFNAAVGLHARLYAWDQEAKVKDVTEELQTAFLMFNIAKAQADVLFPKDSPVHAIMARISTDASHIATDRREAIRMKEYLSMASAEDQLRLANEKVERSNRFYLSTLSELQEALRPYVTYELLAP